MAWIPTAFSFQPLQFRSASLSHKGGIKIWKSRHVWLSFRHVDWNWDKLRRDFVFRAGNDDNNNNGDSPDYEKIEMEPTGDIIKLEKNNSLKELVHIPSPPLTVVRSSLSSKLAIAIYITVTALVLIARKIMLKTRNKNQLNNQGSISDLVRRGQLKSTRRAVLAKSYNDPFDNQFVKSKDDESTVEMFGKTYKLTPSKLTKEKQLTHQERRSRAYQWKRPEVFLKEGDKVPENVDPGSVRWIPSNHPFAETCSDLNEEMVKSNLFQRDGVPSHVRAEHEALQKKLDVEARIKELSVNLNNIEGVDESQKSLEEPNEKKQDDQNPFMKNLKQDEKQDDQNPLMRNKKQDDQNPFMRNHRSA
ncbi:hypothetical protein LUZ60_002449 [Juncus effusus]|nr:hypothetical protein LUZ60_002449 [Juncus effusus]